MAKIKYEAAFGDIHHKVEATTMNIPSDIKVDCKKKGISYKRCFIVGYQSIIGEKDKQFKDELKSMREANKRLQKQLTRISTDMFKLKEQKTLEGA